MNVTVLISKMSLGSHETCALSQGGASQGELSSSSSQQGRLAAVPRRGRGSAPWPGMAVGNR